MKHIIFFAFILSIISAPAFARVNERAVTAFCADPMNVTVIEERGVQPDGKKANEDILALQPDDYDFPNSIEVEIFENGMYAVDFPRRMGDIKGSTGIDLQDKNEIGGCSLEQLSEVLRANGVLPPAPEVEEGSE